MPPYHSRPEALGGIPHKRHSFAVNMLAGWYRDGTDVPARLPWLSTVMGHSGPASTYWYYCQRPRN